MRRLVEAVARARTVEKWREEYMLLYEIKEEGRVKGRAEGIGRGACFCNH